MNMKEKEQNMDVSKQICVHKTQNTLLEFNSFLRMAEPKEFWHLHEDFASDYSRIRAVMVDYSKEDSISVYAAMIFAVFSDVSPFSVKNCTPTLPASIIFPMSMDWIITETCL